MRPLKAWKFWLYFIVVILVMSFLVTYGKQIQVSLEGMTFMPHGHCFYWNEMVLFSFLFGEILIWASYMIISTQLAFVFKRGGKIFNREMLLWFMAFIFMCGITHLIAMLNIFYARYIVEGVFLIFTGVVSVISAVRLHVAKSLIISQISDDTTQIEEAIGVLSNINSKGFKTGELRLETEAVADRLRQLNILKLQFKKDREVKM